MVYLNISDFLIRKKINTTYYKVAFFEKNAFSRENLIMSSIIEYSKNEKYNDIYVP